MYIEICEILICMHSHLQFYGIPAERVLFIRMCKVFYDFMTLAKIVLYMIFVIPL